ncbi:MAG: sulfatase-like hydrolase/transferase [Actinomycetota bacterium]|nr:sulfatase-like hydrolase/transferase [Actinomycetota bacterium]
MPDISRRTLIAAGVAAAAGVAVGADAASAQTAPVRDRRTNRSGAPNIILILVDEMRFPQVFPDGVNTPQEFLERYMPNLATLWKRGVKFANHHTAGTACSPARACLVTGLYPHQNWCLQTRKGTNNGAAGPQAPALQREFPTYGKFLRRAGYRTPYVGKWHLSDSPASATAQGATAYLEAFGFQGLTMPDPVGTNGQGTLDDGNIAGQAATWLQGRHSGEPPFCLTVSFVNPHDKEFFWSGTQADEYNQVFAQAGATPAVTYSLVPPLNVPKKYGYSALPPNWESAKSLSDNKPAAQAFTKSFTDLMWGGVSDDPSHAAGFTLQAYPGVPGAMTAYAGFPYWSRALDSYTQVLSLVDQHIGTVMRAVPERLRDNTIIIMTADHGDYAGAHGFASNKAGTMYREAVNVPLIVVDPRERRTGDLDKVREQLTSSVDIMPMLATLGFGSREWMKGDYEEIYSERLNLLPLLKSNRPRGREHVLMASDEWVPSFYVYNGARRHIMGIRTQEMKVAAYTNWDERGVMQVSSLQAESYDYDTRLGRLELDNQEAEDGRARAHLTALLGRYNRNAIAAPLPRRYRPAVARSKSQYLAYIALLDSLNADGSTDMTSPDWVGNYIHLGT